MDQLEGYVRAVYGSEVDARNYLQKFITVSAKLPKNRRDRSDNDYDKYLRRLLQYYEIGASGRLDMILERMFRYHDYSFREMERCVCSLSLCYSQSVCGDVYSAALIGFLAAIRIRFSSTFDALAASRLSYNGFAGKTDIEQIFPDDDGLYPLTWFSDSFKLLLPWDGAQESIEQGARNYWLGPRRFFEDIKLSRVIPYCCAELSKFKIVAT